MNTILKLASLFLAVALPGAFAAELAGAHLPAAFDPLHIFAAFVGVLVLMSAFADYGQVSARAARFAAERARACRRADNPLAA